jgi:hypothetical protein
MSSELETMSPRDIFSCRHPSPVPTSQIRQSLHFTGRTTCRSKRERGGVGEGEDRDLTLRPGEISADLRRARRSAISAYTSARPRVRRIGEKPVRDWASSGPGKGSSDRVCALGGRGCRVGTSCPPTWSVPTDHRTPTRGMLARPSFFFSFSFFLFISYLF